MSYRPEFADRFILKPKLFGFGTITEAYITFSDIEKTLLDFVYVSKYRSVLEERIIAVLEDYSKHADADKITDYLQFYPKTLGKVAKHAGLV